MTDDRVPTEDAYELDDLDDEIKEVLSTVDAGLVIPQPPASSKSEIKNYYFNNVVVEQLLTVYVKGGCVDVALRDEIMSHAAELIRQIIRTHNLHNIYPGKDSASFGDLFQVAWAQIEKTLYKFDYTAGHTKVFNMMSQVAKTVILAHIKRENRDRKNSGAYKNHLSGKSRLENTIFDRFVAEARLICQYNQEHLIILQHLEELYAVDERPYEGLIGKLIARTGMSRLKIHQFLKTVRSRDFEFSDSPINAPTKLSVLANIRSNRHKNNDEDDGNDD